MNLTKIVNTICFGGTALLLMGVTYSTTVAYTQEAPYARVKPIKTLTIYQDRVERIEKVVYRDRVVVKEVVKNMPPRASGSEQFWLTLINVESGGGKFRYRPTNKTGHCRTTKGACGPHQLRAQALADIKCTSAKCLGSRDDFKSSQALAAEYYNVLQYRYKCFTNDTPNHLKYLCWNQGGSGGKRIVKASKGLAKLSKTMLKNMAGNSPYSYKTLKKWGAKKAATKFINARKKIWDAKRVVI